MKALLWFVFVQLVMLLAMVVGWLALIPFCLSRAWIDGPASIKDRRSIDRWSWEPLNLVYGNPEDGVSGQCALVWVDATIQAPYMPNAWAPWRAYCWSAWRNSADNLKYIFAWEEGPLWTFTLFGRSHSAGWKAENGRKVPVIS